MGDWKLAADIGDRIMALRVARGWSQSDLARRAGLSTRATIAFYELGERMPSSDTVIKLAEVFGVSTDYILTGGGSDRPAEAVTTAEQNGDTFIRIKAGTLTEKSINIVLTLIDMLREPAD